MFWAFEWQIVFYYKSYESIPITSGAGSLQPLRTGQVDKVKLWANSFDFFVRATFGNSSLTDIQREDGMRPRGLGVHFGRGSCPI